MAYNLSPNNPELSEDFRLDTPSWRILFDAFGYLFPKLHDPERFHDGFSVTDYEAKIMARMTRNYVNTQRLLNEPRGLVPYPLSFPLRPLPEKIQPIYVDIFEKFACWAERSGGFTVKS